jgi:ankyrin repeat protein
MEPIHKAAAAGDVDALRRELERGVSPDSVGPHGLVPLNFAAAHGASGEDNQLACVRLLIDAGANVSAASSHNNPMTSLMYAAVGERPTLVAALLDAGADVNHRESRWHRLDGSSLRNV